MKAISTLEEGVAVHYDIAEDFAVLCSNCHRMIHRTADPSNLAAFQALTAIQQGLTGDMNVRCSVANGE